MISWECPVLYLWNNWVYRITCSWSLGSVLTSSSSSSVELWVGFWPRLLFHTFHVLWLCSPLTTLRIQCAKFTSFPWAGAGSWKEPSSCPVLETTTSNGWGISIECKHQHCPVHPLPAHHLLSLMTVLILEKREKKTLEFVPKNKKPQKQAFGTDAISMFGFYSGAGKHMVWHPACTPPCTPFLLKTSDQNKSASLPSPGQMHAETRGQRLESQPCSCAGSSPSKQSEHRPSLTPAASSMQKHKTLVFTGTSLKYTVAENTIAFPTLALKNHNFPTGKHRFFSFK